MQSAVVISARWLRYLSVLIGVKPQSTRNNNIPIKTNCDFSLLLVRLVGWVLGGRWWLLHALLGWFDRDSFGLTRINLDWHFWTDISGLTFPDWLGLIFLNWYFSINLDWYFWINFDWHFWIIVSGSVQSPIDPIFSRTSKATRVSKTNYNYIIIIIKSPKMLAHL